MKTAMLILSGLTKGEIVVLYGTGGVDDNLPTKVFIGGMECEVVWRAGERESPEGVHIALQE